MNIIIWIALALVALILIIALVAYFQKPEFRIIREADFKSLPKEIFTYINSFQNWSAWSPWERMDPELKRTFTGEKAGVGAKYAWVGNKKVGEGNMEITHSTANRSIQLNLNFIKPFTANNITEFTLSPQDGGTRMTWEMRGLRPFGMRLFGLVLNMDKLVGKDFEKGMANLKTVLGE